MGSRPDFSGGLGLWNKPATKHQAFILAVQEHNIHNDILVLPDQRTYLDIRLAFDRIQFLPDGTNLLDVLVRLREGRKQAFSRVGKFFGLKRIGALKRSILALDQGQQFPAQSEMLAQNAGGLWGVQCVGAGSGREDTAGRTCGA